MPLIDSVNFRKIIVHTDPLQIVEDYILADGARHVSDEGINLIKSKLCAKFGLSTDAISVYIVGSAKLGYSLTPKQEAGSYLPRYREFRLKSDIDVAVVSQQLYFKIWRGLSSYSHAVPPPFPWDSGKLGDYSLIGWLRPDYFPIDGRPAVCLDWWDIFGALTRNSLFKGHKVRGALFFHKNFLQEYQIRSVTDCQRKELGA